jgi:hypothetical protein
MRGVTAVVLAAATHVGGLGAVASVPPVSRIAWPGASIGYADLTSGAGYHEAVLRAVTAWNTAAIGVRFVATAPGRANVKVAYRAGRCLSARAGTATFGFRAAGSVVVRSCPKVLRPLLVAHELGRVLGLPVDNSSCSLMNGSGETDGATFALPSRCSRFAPPAWLGRLVDPQTAARARAIYRSPAGPSSVTATVEATPRITWRQPARSGAARTIVLRGQNACPTANDLLRGTVPVIYEKPAFAGLHWADDSTLPRVRASYCYSVFTVNRWFRLTRYPARIGYLFDRAPLAAFTVEASTALVTGAPVAFADRSTDAFGTIVRWHWDFGDPASGGSDTLDTGDPEAGSTPQHLYVQPGTYKVTLTVTDDGGASDSVSVPVVVQASAP